MHSTATNPVLREQASHFSLEQYAARCERMGIQFLITGPRVSTPLCGAIRRFSFRTVDPERIDEWDQRYRDYRADDYIRRGINIDGRLEYFHDPASWRILAIRDDHSVEGAVACRIFDQAPVGDYLNSASLLASASVAHIDPWLAELKAFGSRALAERRTLCEASQWSVGPARRRSPIGLTLMLLLAAVLREFGSFWLFGAANCDSGASALLGRLGASVMTCNEQPMEFFHPLYNARLKFLWLESEALLPHYTASIAPGSIPANVSIISEI